MSALSPSTNGMGGMLEPAKQFIQDFGKTKGWPYAIAWGQRISGTLLVLYIAFHVVTLSALTIPEAYNAKMKILQHPLFVIMAWLLAVPVIFHTLNGGRLLLYEIFGNRKDTLVLRWTLGLSVVYLVLLAGIMLLGNQSVSDLLFWVYMLAVSICLVYVTVNKLKSSGASIFWKLHRISGAFLFLMIPAHMIFMHLNPSVAHEAGVVLARLDNWFIKLIDLALVISVFYHAGYGLITICRDYVSLSSRSLRDGCTGVIIAVMALFAWIGVKLIFVI